MNVLYLHAHDVGCFASIYGADVKTPHLERFASSGATIFTNAHAVAPTCSPSRTGLLTGQYPHQQGMLGLAHRGFSLSHPERHLAAWLRTQGYTTALCGVQHEFDFQKPELLPYDHVSELDWSNGTAGRDRSAAEGAVDLLKAHKGTQPFFLSVGFYWPHVPLPEVSAGAAHNQIAPWPDAEGGRLDTAALQKAIKQTDANMGLVLEALEQSQFADDTLVLVTTDHGVPFPLNKATLHDRGTGILFMLKVPGKPGVARSDALVSNLDFFPTVAELCGLESPDWLEGESLLPVLGGGDTTREFIFTETNHHVDHEPMRAVRTRRHKLIFRFNEAPWSRANVDGSRLKTHAEGQGFFERAQPEWELYDLVDDPDEQNNLAEEPAYAVLREELCTALFKEMERTSDPLRAFVPAQVA